jgi:RHS repeat-associated protein
MRLTGVSTNQVDSQHPSTFTTVDPNLGYWPTSEVRVMTLGNGLAETSVYNNRLEPCRVNVNSSGTYLVSCTDSVPNGNKQDFSYGYSSCCNNGDVWSWTGTGTQTFNRSYTYDGTNRLLTMAAPGDACSGLSWTYDAWGNRSDQTVTGGTCNTFHATVNTNNQLVGSPYQYDAPGNLINDGVHTYTYDPEHRVTGVDGGTTTYEYDAEGRRVETVKSGVWTDFYHGLGSHVTAEFSAAGYGTRYVYFGNRLLATYMSGTSGWTRFVHPDHLSSTRLVTTYSQTQSQNQQIYDSMDYLPYGEQIAGSTGTTHKFTGQERDSESGNDYFGARHYSSARGRFMSADPGPFVWSDPPTFNRYAYARNNPLKYVDPTGQYFVLMPADPHYSQFVGDLAQMLMTPGGREVVDFIAQDWRPSFIGSGTIDQPEDGSFNTGEQLPGETVINGRGYLTSTSTLIDFAALVGANRLSPIVDTNGFETLAHELWHVYSMLSSNSSPFGQAWEAGRAGDSTGSAELYARRVASGYYSIMANLMETALPRNPDVVFNQLNALLDFAEAYHEALDKAQQILNEGCARFGGCLQQQKGENSQ